MTVLAIDTASRRRALCVLATDDGELVAHRHLSGRELDRELPPALQALLSGNPTAVACVMGPGSYTGLRVGIAAALGVAHARGLPLHGIAALDVVALAAPPDALAIEAVADAGRGALYIARYVHEAPGTPALRAVVRARRIEAGQWRGPSAGVVTVSLEAVAGTVDAGERAPAALAAAAALALATPPLPLAGLEPVYLASAPAPRPDV